MADAALVLRSPYGLHGVFLGSHAVSEGLASRKQLRSGVYRRLLKDVYADPRLTADHRLVAHGAMLALPDDAVLGGITAAAWYGAPFASAVEPVVVIAPPNATWRGPRGVRVHRAELPPASIQSVEDDLGIVRMTDAARTAWDVAALETVATAVGFLDGMARAGELDDGTVRRLVATSSGRWRASRVRKVLPLVDGRAESPPESWVRVACVRAGLPAPVPQFEVVHGGVFLGRVDLAWPDQRVIVEYEGAYHFDGLQIPLDDVRLARLVAAGWRVIRVAAHDLRDMDAVVARIAHELRTALSEG
jgi:Protein of unknown function (DUF559)